MIVAYFYFNWFPSTSGNHCHVSKKEHFSSQRLLVATVPTFPPNKIYKKENTKKGEKKRKKGEKKRKQKKKKRKHALLSFTHSWPASPQARKIIEKV